jgi:hypothetical protein
VNANPRPANRERTITSLTGPHISSFRTWLIRLVPTVLFVLVQESPSGLPLPAVLVSAVALHAASGLALFVVLAHWALRGQNSPIVAVAVALTLSGVVRGLVGGAVFHLVMGGDPQFTYRITFWVGVSLVWLPLFGYAVGQLNTRRSLLARLDRARLDFAMARADSLVSSEERTRRLAAALENIVNPIVADLASSLRRARLRGDGFNEIAIDIQRVTSQVSALLEPTGTRGDAPLSASRRTSSPVREAIDFLLVRPKTAAFVVAAEALTMLLPGAIWTESLRAAAGVLLSTAIAVVSLVALLWAVRSMSLTRYARSRLAAAAIPAAGLLGTAALVVVTGPGLDSHALALAVAFPVLFTIGLLSVAAAVGLGYSNGELDDSVEFFETNIAALRELDDQKESLVRSTLAELVHGPILGRLAACAMALNFISMGDAVGSQDEVKVLKQVQSHLTSVSVEVSRVSVKFLEFASEPT